MPRSTRGSWRTRTARPSSWCAHSLRSTRAPGLRRVRVATYQSASGAGIERMEGASLEGSRGGKRRHGLGLSKATSSKRRRSCARRAVRSSTCLSSRSALPVRACRCSVGHSQAVWVETEEPLSPDQAREILSAAPSVSLRRAPDPPAKPSGWDDVLVGRIRQDAAGDGLAMWVVCDNLRKGAALDAIQIAELLGGASGARRLHYGTANLLPEFIVLRKSARVGGGRAPNS